MRRTQGGYGYQPVPTNNGMNHNDMLETENEQMSEDLKRKIGALKNISIEIGNEVKYHNALLRDFDDDIDKTDGFLKSNMKRVMRLGKGGHRSYWCYMFLFALFVFFLLYIILAFR
ncbi:BET1 homolog [Culicoides brevitarsis]|uniref:BET1 homolog n=1 Tax=Culicoides brevitarsis TaxID=469753 RepID=UPI00307BCEFA